MERRVKVPKFTATYFANRYLRNFSVLFVLFYISTSTEAQRIYDDNDPVVSFGLQVGGVFQNNLLNIRSAVSEFNGAEYGVEPVNGFMFGGIVNMRLTNRFYILTGINMLRRDYVAYELFEGNRRETLFRTTTYEIPIMASYYVRLSDNLLLNVATGVPIHFTPTDLFSRNDDLEALSLKMGIFKPVSSTTIGFEWRTEFNGGMYIGAVYNIAPWPLFTTRIADRQITNVGEGAFIDHIGDFFGIVARYYLP